MNIYGLLRKIKYKRLDLYRKLSKRLVYVTKEELKRLDTIEQSFPNVLSTTETLSLIVNNRLSICRFGDAEFDICQNIDKTDKWQHSSEILSDRLYNILKTKREGLLVCIPPFNSTYNNIKYWHGKLNFWQYYWLRRFEALRPLFSLDTYGNSFVSRDAVFYENDLSEIKKIWHCRKVVFVYGKGGRFTYLPELFDNIKEKREIKVPPTNAFDFYDDILSDCLNYDTNWLFLISAGPTATVLAYDLFERGYQALDIGHLPNCYEQYLGVIESPESIPRILEKV